MIGTFKNNKKALIIELWEVINLHTLLRASRKSVWAPSNTHWFFRTFSDTSAMSGSATEAPFSLKLRSGDSQTVGETSENKNKARKHELRERKTQWSMTNLITATLRKAILNWGRGEQCCTIEEASHSSSEQRTEVTFATSKTTWRNHKAFFIIATYYILLASLKTRQN